MRPSRQGATHTSQSGGQDPDLQQIAIVCEEIRKYETIHPYGNDNVIIAMLSKNMASFKAWLGLQQGPVSILAVVLGIHQHNRAYYNLINDHLMQYDNNANICNYKTSTGITPLHIAAYMGDVTHVEYLIRHNVPIVATTGTGLTPVMVAQNPKIIELLTNYMQASNNNNNVNNNANYNPNNDVNSYNPGVSQHFSQHPHHASPAPHGVAQQLSPLEVPYLQQYSFGTNANLNPVVLGNNVQHVVQPPIGLFHSPLAQAHLPVLFPNLSPPSMQPAPGGYPLSGIGTPLSRPR